MKDSEYNVVEVAVPVPVRSSFSYLSKNKILPGTRVKVSFGSRSLIGVVISSSTKPNFQKMFIEDRMFGALPNMDSWIMQTWTKLNRFAKIHNGTKA